MKTIRAQKQVVAIYANKYEIVYTNTDPKNVSKYAKENRAKLKKLGALKVITNIGFYE